MKVERLFSVNELNKYNKVNKINKTNEVAQIKDRIEITDEAKVLSSYAAEPLDNKSARIEEIKRQIAEGTYNIDSRLTAKSMLSSIL